MTGPRADIFQQALKRFKDNLHPSLVSQFSVCNLQDVRDVCRDIQTTQGQQGKLRYMRRLSGFIEAMEQLGKVIELFVNVNEVVCFVWGPIKFLLCIASTYLESFDKLLDVYDQVGNAIPGLMRYQAIFEKHPPLATILEDYYSDILSFHQEALVVFKRPRWKILFDSSWKTFNSKFGPILHSLSKRRELLESEKGSATLYEIQKLRDDLSEIKTQQQHQAAQEDAGKHKQKLSFIREKLEAPHYWIDQEMSTEDRLGHNSGKWIFEDSDFSSWASNDVIGHRVLYVNGIPGAGKTTLMSTIIENLLDDKNSNGIKRCVAYFYFKQNQPNKKSHNNLLRAILAQLIDRDPTMSDHIFKDISSIEGVNLRSTKTLQGLVKAALSSYSISYIVLDGLDECAPTEAEKSVNWFLSLKNGGLEDPTAMLRVLFCGQRDGTLDKLLASQSSISLETSRHTEDIREYCQRFCGRIRSKFNISSTMEEEITLRVTNQAQGMFLYARVVLENLLSQTRLSRLREEMEPGTFPKGIEKAYERVAIRIFEKSPMAEREDATKILGLITCARRLLRWREIQSLFCIDPEKGDVDYEERRLRVTCKELCGSLIDIHHATDGKPCPEDVIKIVHETAREFLFQKKLINASLEHARIAIFCSRYLTSEPFLSSSNKEDVITHASIGYYSLQDYAVQYWFDHLRQCTESAVALPLNQLKEVIKVANVFLETYGDPSKKRTDSSLNGPDGTVRVLTELPNDGRERNEYFTIELRTTIIRNVIEALQRPAPDPAAEEVLVNLHGGTAVYKCPKPWCENFVAGFGSPEDRNQHTNRHDLPFHCPIESCFAFQLGFDSQAKLDKHKTKHHPEPDNDEILFPRIATKKITLVTAIEQADLAAVKTLLDSGNDVNSPRPGEDVARERTPLYWAAKHGQLEVCKLLLERGAQVDRLRGYARSSFAADTPLIVAAESGHFEVCKLLIDNGSDPNLRGSFQRTALIVAAGSGHFDVCKLLIGSKADVSISGRYGRNALHAAVMAGDVHIAHLLVNQEDSLLDTIDMYGKSPFVYACELGHLDIVKFLAETGKVRTSQGVPHPGENGQGIRAITVSPLSYACIKGNFAVAQYLIRQGQSVTWGILEDTAKQGHGAIVDLLLPIAAVNIPSYRVLGYWPKNFVKMQDSWRVFSHPAVSQAAGVDLVRALPDVGKVCCIRFSPDGTYLAIGFSRFVQVYDVVKGDIFRHLDDHPRALVDHAIWHSVCFSPTNRYVAAAGARVGSGFIRVWEIATPTAPRLACNVIIATNGYIFCLEFGPDDRTLTFGGRDGIVRLWDVATSTNRLEVVTDSVVTSIAISPDRMFVATGFGNMLRIRDIKNNYLLAGLNEHKGSIYCIAFSRNGRELVSGSADGTVKIWSFSTTLPITGQGSKQNRCIETFSGHTDVISDVGFTPDSQWVFSCSYKDGVTFWDRHTGQIQFALRGKETNMTLMALSPAGGQLASVSTSGCVQIWSYHPVHSAE